MSHTSLPPQLQASKAAAVTAEHVAGKNNPVLPAFCAWAQLTVAPFTVILPFGLPIGKPSQMSHFATLASGTGPRVGLTVGAGVAAMIKAVGTKEGNELGSPEGSEEGSKEGSEEGAEVGSEEGVDDGLAEGAVDGSAEGTDEGTWVGSEDGFKDGSEEGFDVGLSLGLLLGSLLGLSLGAGVTAMIKAVGTKEGTELGSLLSSWIQQGDWALACTMLHLPDEISPASPAACASWQLSIESLIMSKPFGLRIGEPSQMSQTGAGGW
jgi:hypothetical protein